MADFDISTDELPIFLAEADENLQALDKVLLDLEKNHDNDEFIQIAFRAAHTLKGMAGMINHERMVAATHALETIFDAVRKKSLEVSSQLIDSCLDTVDALRELKGEVEYATASDVDVEMLVAGLTDLLQQGRVNQLQTHLENVNQQPQVIPAPVKTSSTSKKKAAKQSKPAEEEKQHLSDLDAFLSRVNGDLPILAEISPKSIASAARAFQLILALQEIGQIVFQTPAMEVIDSALPVQQFMAAVKTDKAVDEIRKNLSMVSEVDHLYIGKDEISNRQHADKTPQNVEQPEKKDGYHMLGDYLVKHMIITPDQLQSVLISQKSGKEQKLLGQILVEKGLLNQNQLDDAIKHMIQEEKEAVHTEKEKASPQRTEGHEMTIRTSVTHLNALLNMVGELITDRNHLYQLRSRMHANAAQYHDIEELSETVAHLGRITDQLQEEVLSIRMLPISNVFNKFPRMVRDLSRKMNKKIELVIHGEETELDRSVIEEINDPIIHMLRNSIDHGIEDAETRKAANKPEVGTIVLSAKHEQGHIIITVEDDGRGIDAASLRKSAVSKGLLTQEEVDHLSDEEAVNLIFMSGLSTSKEITDISGRGVGMDIVRNNIQRINGTISVESRKGQGTQFQVILPLTLAIVPTMLVELCKTTFAFPLVMVAEILRIERKDIQTIRGKPVTRLRNTVLPLISLSELFEFEDGQRKNAAWHYVVVVHYGKLTAGIVVDRLLGQEEVVVKSLGSLIGDIAGISSAAILGDGRVALIIDVPGLLQTSGVH